MGKIERRAHNPPRWFFPLLRNPDLHCQTFRDDAWCFQRIRFILYTEHEEPPNYLTACPSLTHTVRSFRYLRSSFLVFLPLLLRKRQSTSQAKLPISARRLQVSQPPPHGHQYLGLRAGQDLTPEELTTLGVAEACAGILRFSG